MFTAYPTYDNYRVLEAKTPYLKGEDIYALQTALDYLLFEVGELDGVHGPMTDRALRECQRELSLVVDGRAGEKTQPMIAFAIAFPMAIKKLVPQEAPRGQIEWEALGGRLGPHGPKRANGSYDAGVTQRNTEHTPPQEGFNVPGSIKALLEDNRKHFDLFAGIRSLERRWALAQGAWNAPAFACYIAREEGAKQVTPGMVLRPSEQSRNTFENYVAKVSKYLPKTL